MTRSYAGVYDPTCPWGYWMRPVGTADGDVSYLDEDGSSWASHREAFWCGRLAMSSMFAADEILDQIAEVLAWVQDRSARHTYPWPNLDRETLEFFQLWLNSVGLAHHGEKPLPLTELSEEGVAVLAMLRMTKLRAPTPRWTPRELHEHALHIAQTSVAGCSPNRPAKGRAHAAPMRR